MKKTLLRFISSHPRFVLYALIGAIGIGVDFFAFGILTQFFKINRNIANIISASSGIVNNYTLNTIYNFKPEGKHLQRFFSYASIGVLGIIVSTLLLDGMVVYFHFHELFAKAITLIVVPLSQYFLNKWITYK